MLYLFTLALLSQVGGIGGYTVGACLAKNTPVNTEVSKLGISRFDVLVAHGGSGYSISNNLLLGGTGFGAGFKGENDTLTVEYGIGGGYFEFGYTYSLTNSVFPFVMMGVGGFSESAIIRKKIQNIPWDSVWTNPLREVEISRGSFSLAPSAGILVFPNKSFVGVLIKFTYNTILTKEWKVREEIKILNSPSSPLGYLTFSASIVFGGMTRRK
ncbi:MAG: hypothetical protein ABIM31_05140 [candidate division WOR-3 bacterium]